MHNPRNASYILANFVLFLLPMSAFADAVDLVQVDVTDSEAQAAGLKVLRLYVQFDGPDDRLLTVESIDLTTDDPQGFFQHEFGLDLAPFAALCTIPGLELLCSDSYVTIGADTAVGNSTALGATRCDELVAALRKAAGDRVAGTSMISIIQPGDLSATGRKALTRAFTALT